MARDTITPLFADESDARASSGAENSLRADELNVNSRRVPRSMRRGDRQHSSRE
jgi:hypothetical protein